MPDHQQNHQWMSKLNIWNSYYQKVMELQIYHWLLPATLILSNSISIIPKSNFMHNSFNFAYDMHKIDKFSNIHDVRKFCCCWFEVFLNFSGNFFFGHHINTYDEKVLKSTTATCSSSESLFRRDSKLSIKCSFWVNEKLVVT